MPKPDHVYGAPRAALWTGRSARSGADRSPPLASIARRRSRLAGVCLFALASASLPQISARADEAEDLKQMLGDQSDAAYEALEKLYNGDLTEAQFNAAIAEAGGEILIGLADLAGVAIGVPGLGSAAETVFGLFGLGAAGNDPTEQRFELIEKRLDAIDTKLATMLQLIDGLTEKIAETRNKSRLEFLKRDVNNLKKNAVDLQNNQLTGLLDKILIDAAVFLPNAGDERHMLWHWTDVKISVDKNGNRLPLTTVERRTTELALEAYMHAIALIDDVRAAAGGANAEQRAKIAQHIEFLTGRNASADTDFAFNLYDHFRPVRCGAAMDSASIEDPNLYCELSVRCSTPGNGKVDSLEEREPISRESLGLDSNDRCFFYPENTYGRLVDDLTRQLLNKPTRASRLLEAAAQRLEKAPISRYDRLGVKPNDDELALVGKAVVAEHQVYAVGSQTGGLRSYRHRVLSRDLWKWGERSKTPQDSCAGPDARYKVECTPNIPAQKVDCRDLVNRASMQCQAPIAPPPPDPNRSLGVENDLPLARYEISHDFSAQLDLRGNWRRFESLIGIGEATPIGFIGVPAEGPPTFVGTEKVAGGDWWRLKETPVSEIGWSSSGEIIGQAQLRGRRLSDFTALAPSGDGVVYGLAPNGDLHWIICEYIGTSPTLHCTSRAVVGRGWNSYKHVFATSEGTIYAVEPNGDLYWYRHNGFATGEGLETPGSWSDRRKVGVGWSGFAHLTAGPGGSIYAVTAAGDLLFYQHIGWENGAADWEKPVTLAKEWSDIRLLFVPIDAKVEPVLVK